MRTIWKEALKDPCSTLRMPVGSTILSVGPDLQGTSVLPSIWFEVPNDHSEREERTFAVFGTGHELPEDPGKYLGTATSPGGQFVWHVYERVQ